MLKKGLSIFVLSIFLAHFAGFYIYYIVQLKWVQQEMRSKLKDSPAEELQLITLTKSEYQNARVEDHEIKVAGKMYDVARIEEKNGSILAYCLHDGSEDNLMTFIDKILKLPLKDKKVPPQIVKFTSLTFILPLGVRWEESSVTFAKNATRYSLYVSSFIPALDSPPPQSAILMVI